MSRYRISGLVLALTLLLSGCVQTKPAQRQVFAMDTFMTLTAYGSKAQAALEQAEGYILDLEGDISVTRSTSGIAALNKDDGHRVQLSEQAFALLTDAVELCRLTDGVLDITSYPAVKAWGFTTGEHRVPSGEELAQLANSIDYTVLSLDPTDHTAALPAQSGMAVDLGAVAKGWTGKQLAGMLKDTGIKSALLSLGGNVQTVGAKPDGSPWRVGIQDPDSQTGAYLASVAVTDKAVVTSGGYQRYFEQDGETYWHILDPQTAAPARSGVTSVTIVGADGGLCDAFSTALFIMGAEDAAAFWKANPQLEFDYVLVLEDGSIHVTQGLEGSFALVDGYQDRKVTVIAP